MKKITHARLVSVLKYNPNIGVFTWLADTSKRKRVGTVAGSRFKYAYLSVDNMHCSAHRLAFFYMKKRWPKHEIDHKNGNTLDNRWINLREATSAQNKMNKVAAGVTWDKNRNKWMAKIQVNKRTINLGRFKTANAARAARLVAQKSYFGEFGRL